MDKINNSNAGMGLGIAGLVLGILSVPLGIMPCTFATGLVFGILGITMSALGLSQARKAKAQTGLIIAALIVSIIGTGFAFVKLTSSVSKLKNFTERVKYKIEILDEHSDEFEEGFESEFDDMEETLEELEELDEELQDMDDELEELEQEFEDMDDEEKARKLGRATGKAVKEFVKVLKDTTDSEE